MKQTSQIISYHAHVYFDANTVDQARDLCQTAAKTFGLKQGHMHQQNVGPHPMWSCLLLTTPAQFSEVLPWLALNRDGLIIFAHPETGDHLKDHRDHGIWLGTGLDLDLSSFG